MDQQSDRNMYSKRVCLTISFKPGEKFGVFEINTNVELKLYRTCSFLKDFDLNLMSIFH